MCKKYDAVYFVCDNQAINSVQVGSSKMRNQGVFSGLLAALVIMRAWAYSQFLFVVILHFCNGKNYTLFIS